MKRIDGATRDVPLPERIGRYRVTGILGSGSAGTVYRGEDESLGRSIAIKVPHRHLLDEPNALHTFFAEARTLAQLDCPGIVPVYDVGRTTDVLCFLVAKLINGSDLKTRLKQGRPSRIEAVELAARVAEALHHAHSNGLIHRDVKPANVLLDDAGNPVVVDFGLALREQDVGRGPSFVGTIPYMSPEQARRESHRVDARTDVYSLGVILYEMLVGRRPFVSDTRDELLELIRTQEVPPPRTLDATISSELERICLKALANRSSDRYASAQALAEDLRAWQRTRTSGMRAASSDVATASSPAGTAPPALEAAAHVVPRGLRAYGGEDAGFFLQLVPGPRDRHGLPDRLAFWKARLEATETDGATRVCVMYGPSGCGKSSLVKAGLLPRLAPHVRTLFVEASSNQTIDGLLHAVRQAFPELPPDLGLSDAFFALRRGRGLAAGEKVVVVLDQFEQWLHAVRGEAGRVLVEALRQCDGSRLQCLLLVRDDFWLNLNRFLQELEVPLVECVNAALVDLFDVPHARKVLAEHGRSYGRLPDDLAACTPEQRLFLDRAVEGLAEQGKVVPVRLALFSEMVKGRPWCPATLRAVGGASGVGVAFLEDTFRCPRAPAVFRQHERAARDVLTALLPEPGSNLKAPHTRTELLAASGYGNDAHAFEALLQLLDGQLRLISLTDSGCRESAEEARFQLTHDYLVPAVRDWTAQRLRSTRQGRARLVLEERSRAWNAWPENRHLPSWLEWVQIGLLTRWYAWTEPQRRMLRVATWRHGLRTALLTALVLAVGGIELVAAHRREHQRNASRADVVVAWIKQPQESQLENLVEELAPYRQWVIPRLHALIDDPTTTRDERLRARLLLVHAEPEQVEALKEELVTTGPQGVIEIRRVLMAHRAEVVPQFWARVEDPKTPGPERLRLGGALAGLDPENQRWLTARDAIDEELVLVNNLTLPDWLEVFRPVREDILIGLKRFGLEGDHKELVADVVVEYGADYVNFLTRVMAQFEPRQAKRIWPTFAAHGAGAVAECEKELKRPLPDESINQVSRRHARLGVALLRLGAPEKTWEMLRHDPQPRTRSYLVHYLAPFGAEAEALARRYADEPDASARRALLWALGEYAREKVPEDVRKALEKKLLHDFRHDPDPGIHAAAEWLLRRWKVEPELPPSARDAAGERRWYVNGAGHVMVLVPPSKGQRSFAIASKETTVAQFLRLLPDTEYETQVCTSPSVPILGLSWNQAARYCRLLSEREGIPEEEMCYPPIDQIGPAMQLPVNYLERTGYRMPTEVEWERACRAGTTTKRYYGDADDLLVHYGWFTANALELAHPPGLLKPNDFGLFDTLGSAKEWCDDWYLPVPGEASAAVWALYHDRYKAKVLRSGDLSDAASALDAAARAWEPSDHRNHHHTGLRVVRTVRRGKAQ